MSREVRKQIVAEEKSRETIKISITTTNSRLTTFPSCYFSSFKVFKVL